MRFIPTLGLSGLVLALAATIAVAQHPAATRATGQATAPVAAPAPPASTPSGDGVPVYAATVVNRLPHDDKAFTEGLLFCDGALYESTGEVGRSDIRRVDLATGKVQARAQVPPDLFGEGIACGKTSLLSVTWQTGVGFRWALPSLKRTGRFTYAGEGWAMTTDGARVILSDGTPTLRFMDPVTFKERGRLPVTLNGRPLKNLNEIEYVRGEILANVWMSGFIARINPASGAVTGVIDLRPLVAEIGATDRDAVLNGIAYDAASDRLFVTGKYWPTLFEIEIGEEVGRAR